MLVGYCGSISCLEDCRFCSLYESWEIEEMVDEMGNYNGFQFQDPCKNVEAPE